MVDVIAICKWLGTIKNLKEINEIVGGITFLKRDARRKNLDENQRDCQLELKYLDEDCW